MINTIALDWNGTLQDTIGEIIFQSGYRLKRSDFAVWDDTTACWKVNMSPTEFIEFCWKNPDIQRQAKPFPGVKQALRKMKLLGWHIKIVTASFMPASEITEWFNTHGLPFDEIIKAKDKSQVEWDILIDDSPDTLQKMNRPVIKFDLPWNAQVEDVHHFGDWRTL